MFANVCLSDVVSVLLSFARPKLFRPVDLSFTENYISTKNSFLMNCLLQAADIDISSLVEIEKNSPHRLEFFMGLTGDHPICARTAWAYGKAGGRISHAISVYSCQLREPNQVRNSFSYLFVDIFFT